MKATFFRVSSDVAYYKALYIALASWIVQVDTIFWILSNQSSSNIRFNIYSNRRGSWGYWAHVSRGFAINKEVFFSFLENVPFSQGKQRPRSIMLPILWDAFREISSNLCVGLLNSNIPSPSPLLFSLNFTKSVAFYVEINSKKCQ